MKLLVVVILAMFAYAIAEFTPEDEKHIETTFGAAPDGTLHLIVKRDTEMSSCVDKKPSCAKWGSKGYCDKKKYKVYMAKYCKKSCDSCKKNIDEKKSCEDNNKSCKKWGKRNYCSNAKYSKFMKAKCRKTCGICQDDIATTQSTTLEETTISATAPMQSTTKQEYTTTVNVTSPMSTAFNQEDSTSATWSTAIETTVYNQKVTANTSPMATALNQEDSTSATWSTAIETTVPNQEVTSNADKPLCVDSDRIPCGFLAAYCTRSDYARINCPYSCGLCNSSSIAKTTIQPATEVITQQQVADETTLSIDLSSARTTVSEFENVTESESTIFFSSTIPSSTATYSSMAETTKENSDINYTSPSYVTYYIILNSTVPELTNTEFTDSTTTVDSLTDSSMLSTIEPVNSTLSSIVDLQTDTVSTEATSIDQVTKAIEDLSPEVSTTMSQISTSYKEQTTSDSINTTAISVTTEESSQNNSCYDNRICTRYSPEMCNSSVTFQRYCPVMCNMCEPAEEVTTTFSTTAVTTAPESCMDLSINCKDHFQRCNISETVRNLCRESCGLCSMKQPDNATEISCTDSSESCLNLKQFCTNSKLGEKIREKCPQTCGICKNVVVVATTSPFIISTNAALPNTTLTLPTVTQSTAVSNDCADDYTECPSLSVFCTTNLQLAASCRLTCGNCARNFTSDVTTTTTSDSTTASPDNVTFKSTTVPTTVEEEKCEDSFSRCSELKFKCRDPTSIEYLRISCKKTCGFCTGVETGDNSVALKEWSTWSACNAACGQGVQRRVKECSNQDEKCTKDLPTEYRTCQRKICREETTTCADRMKVESCQRYKNSQSCGMKVIGSLCMKTCEFCGTPETDQDQMTNTDAIEGVFTIWSEWGRCSASCGEGVMKRNRTCKSPYQQFENIICIGLPVEENRCVSKSCVSQVTDPNTELCEDKSERCESWKNKGFCLETYTLYMRKNCAKSCGVCGVWDEWIEWSSCSANCGGGNQERKRACKTVACKGFAKESRNCNTAPCGDNQTSPDTDENVEECRDLTPTCKTINKIEKCKETIWTLMCKETCGLCSGTTDSSEACQDKDPQCKAAAATGRCNVEQVKSLCPLSCNLCPDTNTGARTLNKGCSDDRVTCPQLVKQLTCEISYVKDSCKASCGLCQGECKDTSEKCPLLMKNGQCNNPMVLEGCPKSCGKCSDTSSLSKEICKDDSVQCPLVFQQGQCSVGEYAKFCRKSCNLCTTAAQGDTPCKDKTTQCASLKTMGQCSNAIVAESCKVTCGLCNNAAGSACRDETANCNVFVGLNQCSNPAISKVCAKSCNLCNSPAPELQCQDQHELCATYAAMNQCNDPKIQASCKKSCNQCRSRSSPKSCVDSSANCKIYAGAKLCNNSAIKKSCPKSCQLCENNCRDSISTCPVLVKSLKCENSIVLNSCQKSCGRCAQLAAEASCVDSYPQCGMIKTLGQCDNKLMSSMCRKTCNKCNIEEDGPCEDAMETCSTVASLGMCQRDNVKAMCRKSCKLCITTESTNEEVKEDENRKQEDTKVSLRPCKDLRNDGCQKFKERGYCDIDYIRDMCNKTCNACSNSNPGKIKDNRINEDECEDVSDECNKHRGTNRCKRDENIQFLCPKTCNTCVRPKITDCRDTVNCSNLADQCNLQQVQVICKKTCMKCDMEGSDQALDNYEINNACRDKVYNCPKNKCGQSGATEEYKNHLEKMCPSTCNLCNKDDYGVWGSWSRCSVTCGGGSRERNRICKKGKSCVGISPISVGVCGKDRCTTVKKFDASKCVDNSNDCAKLVAEGHCNINGVYKESMKVKCAKSCKFCVPEWMNWSSWSACHDSQGNLAQCGEAYKKRTRECESPGECEGTPEQNKLCVQEACSEYSAWSDWTNCSVSCGVGEQTRQRMCDGVCVGPNNETRSCNDGDCSVWDEWSEWTECSVSCGGGTSTRTRNCVAEEKELCKKEDSKDTKQCGINTCVEWKMWSAWTECSKSCGGGTMSRKRECDGENCDGDAEETTDCSVQICDDTSEWGEWTVFEECDVKCGKGVVKRERDCLNGIPGSGGCAGTSKDTQECEGNFCWSEWTWSACNKDCAGGYKMAQRECLRPSKVCEGEDEIMKMCNTHACPSWSDWDTPLPCSKACGGGVIIKKRKCLAYDSSLRNIAECGTLSDAIITTECNMESCYAGCIEEEIEIEKDDNVQFMSSPSPPGFGAAEGWIKESPYAWCPYSSTENQWIEIKFPEKVNMTGITVAGYSPPMAAPTKATNPLMFEIYNKEISMSTNFVKIGQYLGPNVMQKSIKWNWNPVYDDSWKIELKQNLPTDFPCLRFTFHECEQISHENNISNGNEGSGIEN